MILMGLGGGYGFWGRRERVRNGARCAPYLASENVKFYSNNKVEGVSYKVKLPYGPTTTAEILDFYNLRLQKMGYIPFVEEHNKNVDRDWQLFIDSTLKGAPWVAQLNASWVNPNKTKRANLNLRYYSYSNIGSGNIINFGEDLNVNFQIGLFANYPPPEKADANKHN